MTMERIDVAIAIVFRQGNVLICQRLARSPLARLWEFPGGKREGGESLQACVVREIAEELGIRVLPVRALDPIDHDYQTVAIRLHPFICRVSEGEPQPLASQQVRWIAPADFGDYSFPPANEVLLREVRDFFAAVALSPDRFPQFK